MKFLNSTFLTFIPKRSRAIEFEDFGPINLVDCIYKLIAKLLARRLSMVLGEVIGERQHAFISGKIDPRCRDGFQ